MRVRLEALERHYPWIDPAGSSTSRTWPVAPRDAQYALDLTVERCRTREQQDAAVAALRFKTEVWAQLDDRARHAGRDASSPGHRRAAAVRRGARGARAADPGGCRAAQPTAAEVLELCDGERSLDDIVGALSARYDGR